MLGQLYKTHLQVYAFYCCALRKCVVNNRLNHTHRLSNTQQGWEWGAWSTTQRRGSIVIAELWCCGCGSRIGCENAINRRNYGYMNSLIFRWCWTVKWLNGKIVFSSHNLFGLLIWCFRWNNGHQFLVLHQIHNNGYFRIIIEILILFFSGFRHHENK